MPRLHFVFVLGFCFTACRCGPDTATPVTFRIKNSLSTPIFVDQSDGRAGLVVQRGVFGEWHSFVEQPPCECMSCDLVCGGCECAVEPPPAMVMKIEPGGTFEREWSGVVLQDSNASCPDTLIQGPPCLKSENAPLDEEFRVEFCYAPSSQGADDAEPGVTVPGSLPKDSILCVQEPFRIQDGLVELTPTRGAECSRHEDCTGSGELCFSGACTTACPATGYPTLGSGWEVRIPEPQNMGFFTYSVVGEDERYTGTGKLTSVQYENNTMTLFLVEVLPNGANGAGGAVYVTLPPGAAVPLTVGEILSVTVVDRSTDKNPENRGVVIRDQGGMLLLAAETGQKNRVLEDAEIAPVTVSRTAEIVGCQHGECGKNRFHTTRFSFGMEAVELEPGQSAEVVAAQNTWQVVNVWNSTYDGTWCTFDQLMPYVIVNVRAQGMGP